MTVVSRDLTMSKAAAAYLFGKASLHDLMREIKAESNRQREKLKGIE